MTTLSSFDTNWIASRGSLDSTVTFESFDFPIDSESTLRNPPLLLVPPSSSDFEPCEVKLNFTQKHEIRQVYVKSTARVYEIYYAPSLQSDNEYLCTVRCSAASAEDNLFLDTDFKESSSVNSVAPNDTIQKARIGSENKIGTNEDDWVEVKLPVGQAHDGNEFLPKQTSNNSRNCQDYYEATAEINDSEPCMSLTLRLLSLQSKGCVYVSEVYVFADPIDTNDSENQIINTGISANSSLMSMLVPTLVGLTKSRSVQLHDQISSNPVTKLVKAESESATSTNPVDQQDENLLKPSEAKAELTQSQLPTSYPDKDKVLDLTLRNDFSSNRAEILLEQLVSRVSRIEDICMRFEEKMLKPINNMETRLQRVEEQVELLGKKSWCPVSPSFSRFEPNPRSVSNEVKYSEICGEPDSSNEYEPNARSVRNEVNDSQSCGEPDSLNEFEPNPISVSNEVDDFKICGKSDPSSEVKDGLESALEVNESPKKEKLKKTVSVDDAMAAALAGFSSFTASPLESPEIDEASVSSEFILKETPPESSEFIPKEPPPESSEFIPKETPPESTGEESYTSCDVFTEILENSSFHRHDIPEETETDAKLVKQEFIEAVKILSFDKNDILKYFPDQPTSSATESGVDFESPILEVKFASLEYGSFESSFKDLLSDGAADEGIVNDKEKTTTTNSNLLVDLGGDDVRESMQKDLPPLQLETPFASLI